MIEIDATWFFVLLNVVALLALILAGWIFLWWRRKRKSRSQAGAVAASFRDGRDARGSANRQFLSHLGALAEPALTAEATALEALEARFFEQWLTAYVRHDPEQLQQAHASVAELLDRLRRQPVTQAPAQSGVDEGESEAVLALEARLATKEAVMLKLQMENDKLQRDLNQSKHDIETMMEEYSAMFEGGTHEEERRERKKDEAKHRIVDPEESDAESGPAPEPEPGAETVDSDDEIEALLAAARSEPAADKIVDAADVDDEFEQALRAAAERKE